MKREDLKNQINSKIVNDELSEDEMMYDIMKMVDAYVSKQLSIAAVGKSFYCHNNKYMENEICFKQCDYCLNKQKQQ